MSLIVGVTGHRPKKLGGEDPYSAHTFKRLTDLATAAFWKWGATEVLTGMALGWDQAACQAAIDLGIPFTAIIPFEGQDARWPKQARKDYALFRARATREVVVGVKESANRAMQDRNIWIVDHCQLLAALYNGSGGGTKNCLDYADYKGRRVVSLWGSWVKYKDKGS